MKLRLMGELAALVLAHQGGWDEILMVLVPVAVFVVLLMVARRRAAVPDDEDRRTVGPA